MNGQTATFASVRNLKKLFPLRRGLADFLAGREPRYVRAVDGVDFDIGRKEVFVVVGESGCGKTTTAKLLLGALRPDEGQVMVDGKNIANLHGAELKAFRREAQMIFQDPYSSLDPRMTVLDSLTEPLVVHGITKNFDERREAAVQAMEEVKLTPPEDFLQRYPHMLSGGQRQRLAVARALILKPKLIVADEPVSMLDLSIRAEILELLQTIRDKHGVTYFYITHDLSTARYVGDTIAIMYLGKIVEIGPAEAVLSKPLHPYTQALMDAVPEPDPSSRHRQRTVRIRGEVPSAIEIPAGCRFHTRCPYVMDICKIKEPPLLQVEAGHPTACHLYPEGKTLSLTLSPTKVG